MAMQCCSMGMLVRPGKGTLLRFIRCAPDDPCVSAPHSSGNGLALVIRGRLPARTCCWRGQRETVKDCQGPPHALASSPAQR
jgi:hypothetical protein